ncbi:MAG TPA: DUF72 domain-containing protein [Candidatus Acidoferrum sp.]|jgi:uncharacterized protein YecE (DUF72 family)
MSQSGKIRIGISGWQYEPWRGDFYPEKLPQKKELNFAANTLTSIEINGTFYSLQRPTSFEKWAAETPDEFVFSVKAPRFITHIRRLTDVDAPVANFLASGILLLGKKLGPILWQLPPSFHCDIPKMEAFVKLLPHDTHAANRTAGKHDKWMSDRAAFDKSGESRPVRHAIEIRHKSFAVPEFLELLRAYNVAIVCADTVEWPRITDVTADFVYCRLHGSEKLYASGYDAKSIKMWAEWTTAWASGEEPKTDRTLKKSPPKMARDVFAYFDNDVKVRAPFDAQALIKQVSDKS